MVFIGRSAITPLGAKSDANERLSLKFDGLLWMCLPSGYSNLYKLMKLSHCSFVELLEYFLRCQSRSYSG